METDGVPSPPGNVLQESTQPATSAVPATIVEPATNTLSTVPLPSTPHKGQTDVKQQPNAQAFLQDSAGNPLFPSLHRLRLESNQIMNQSTQQMATVLKKGTKWNKDVSEHVTSAFNRSQSTVSTAFSKSHTAIKSALMNFKSGSSVKTAYGVGKIASYNEATGMFRVQLSFGTLFTLDVSEATTTKKPATTLELNSAYESWEQARRQSVKEECAKLGIQFTESTMHTCFSCLKEPATKAKPALTDASGKPMFPMLYKLRQSGQDAVLNVRKSESPCLLCAAVTCNRHSSEAFRKEGITVCHDCVKWLEYDFASARLPDDVYQYVQHLVDLYQRAHLLLQYCSQFILATANSLEQTTKQHNHIGVGGSGAGLVSGVLGVAAACTILTPAGPPLLVASLVFGGSATAVQTGSEAYKYYGEPNQFANRILTLQGIAERILAVVKTMRDSTLLPYLAMATSKEDEKAATCTGHLNHNDHTKTMKESATMAGVMIGSNAATSASLVAQEAAITGRFVSRATTAAARTARFARFAGGALSAATLVLEAREMHKTLDQIKLGSPCEKAEALRTVHANLSNMPSTIYVKNMCESYNKVRSKELFKAAFAENGQSEMAATSVSMVDRVPETVETSANAVDDSDWVLAEEIVTGLEAAQGSPSSSVTSTTYEQSSKGSKLSLLERVKRFKQREAEKGRQ